MHKLQILFVAISLFWLSSCGNKTSDSATTEIDPTTITAPIILSPGTDTIKFPTTILLSEKPKPAFIVMPSKTDGSYIRQFKSGQKKIYLQPPTRQLFDTLLHQGNPTFKTFSTDDGLALDAVNCATEDKAGNLWFGISGGGVSKYDGKSFTNFTTQQGLAHNVVLSITEDKTGNLWFGTDGGGVSKYDGKSFINFTTQNGLANNVVRSITEDKTGKIWFGTYGGGVCKYEPSSKEGQLGIFTNFTTQQGLTNNAIWSITEDKTGNLWFGTYGGGVSKYDGNRVEEIERLTAEGKSIPPGALQGLKKENGKLVKSLINFTTQQGLANDVVLCITEDKTGNLWFGTDGGGVSKYEPSSKEGQVGTFTNFTTQQGLANNIIWSITEDKTGNLWFGTQGGGVSKYEPSLKEGQVGTFTNFTTQQGLANNVVKSITEDKTGNLWFGTYGGGVSKHDGKSFTSFTTQQGLANNMVFSITEDKTGNLWFGTDGGGVTKYDGKSFTNFTTQQGLANNFVFSITEDKTGNLWFGTFGGGVSKYDGNRVEEIERLIAVGKPIPSGALQGLKKENGKLVKSFTNFTTQQGLANDVVMGITEDKTGNLWFGTYGGGVSKYDGNRVEEIERLTAEGKSIPPGALQGLKKENGKLVKSFTNYTNQQGLANNVVSVITEDKTGNLWFGTYGGGVSKYDGNRVEEIERLTAEGKSIPPGALQGLKKGKGKLVKSFTNFTTQQGLANNFVFSLIEDKAGNLWFATSGGGVSKYEPSLKEGQVGTFTNFTTQKGLAKQEIRTSQTAQKQLPAKLSKKNDPSSDSDLTSVMARKIKYFENYTITEGLPDNVVTQIVEANNGKMLIATNFGFCELIPSPSEKGKGVRYKVGRTFNTLTGYPVKDINVGQKCMFKDSKGIVWMGTGANKIALVRFDETALNINTQPPIVVIKSIKINGEDVCWYNAKDTSASLIEEQQVYGKTLSSESRTKMHNKYKAIKFDGITKWYPIPTNLVLPYNNNNITINFNAIETSRHFLVRYQYILEGYDKDWSPVTDKDNATFGNMFEGTYTFKLKAMSPEGVWSEPISYSFKVLPPFYRTWWAFAIYFLALIGAIIFIVRWNGRKLRARAKQLETEVEQATYEIRLQKEVVEKQKHIVEEQKQIVEEKHKEITDSINYAERIQRSFLASDEMLRANLQEHFVFFQPKDVVSGDFYWAVSLGEADNNKFMLCTADSTGHGVPGAIMSLLNITSLEKAIEAYTEPAEILNATRKTIIERLKKDGSAEGGKDGMDCSLIAFDFKTRQMTYAAANNPIWIVRQSQASEQELIELKPDKMPVGKHDKDSISFTQQSVELQKGDVVYALTDGLPDQFGGPKGKKFMYKQMKELLLSIAHLKLEEQKLKLSTAINTWKGEYEQVDDICVIGVKI